MSIHLYIYCNREYNHEYCLQLAMGIGIPKNIQSIDQFLIRNTQYEVKKADYINKSVIAWQIHDDKCDSIVWPFRFKSSACYIFMVLSTPQIDRRQAVKREQTPIQIGEMLFDIQFLEKYLTQTYLIGQSQNKKQHLYRFSVYLYTGDSLAGFLADHSQQKYIQNQCQQKQHNFQVPSFLKSKAVFYFCRLGLCIKNMGLFLALSILNKINGKLSPITKYLPQQTESAYIFPISFKNECLQFVDLKLQHYENLSNCQIINKQLYNYELKSKNKLAELQKQKNKDQIKIQSDFFQWVHIQINQNQLEEQTNNNKRNNKKQFSLNDQSLPFACQITQIENKKKQKLVVQKDNIDESNMFFEQLGITHSIPQKIQEFLKGLFLGTEKVARNYNILSDKKIKLIINCAPDVCRNWFVNDIDYRWMFIPDPLKKETDVSINIECLIYETVDLLGKYFSKDHAVLLHCTDYDGVSKEAGSRSVALLIGIIMVSLNITFQEAQKIVIKKWETTIPKILKQQLLNLERRRKYKPKQYRIFAICSYSLEAPNHLVAKYLIDIQTIQNIQGLQNSDEFIYICLGSSSKIMIGPKCEYRQAHQKYAKQYIKKLFKYQLGSQHSITVQILQKTFRKQAKLFHKQILHMVSPNLTKIHQSMYFSGYVRNQEITFKYPILRPVWEKKKKDDAFYFTVKQSAAIDQRSENNKKQDINACIILHKGSKWMGFEEDQKKFLQKIIEKYLTYMPEDCILLQYEGENDANDKSLFDQSVFALQS